MLFSRRLHRFGWTGTNIFTRRRRATRGFAGAVACERLEDRTLLAGTPLSLTAAVDGTVTDRPMDGTWDAVDTSSSSVDIQLLAPFPGWEGREERGVFEFDVSSAAGASLESASLFIDPNLGSSSGTEVMRFSVYAYAADGFVTIADTTRTALKVGDLAIDPAVEDILAPKSIALNAELLEPLVVAGERVGLLMVVDSPDGAQFGVWSREISDPALRPKLNLVVVPTTVVVDTLVDEDDGNYSAGDLSLREAVKIVAPGGNVSFATALDGGTITLTQGRIDLAQDVTITGLGADRLTVSGGNVSQVFSIGLGSSVAISGLTLTHGNSTAAGGAIESAGALSLSEVVVSASTAATRGGGVSSTGTLTVSSVTFVGNVARDGGGVYTAATFASSNVTFSDNAAVYGGGLQVAGGTAVLRNTTVFANRAARFWTGGGGTVPGNGGGLHRAAGTITIHNSLVAGNWLGDINRSEQDLAGAFDATSRNNVIGHAASALTDGVNGNIVGVSADGLVDPVLRDNGGPTPTHALLPRSIAINAGNNADALDPLGLALTVDQRDTGFARIVGGVVDVGAVEAQTLPPTSVVVDTLVDEDDGNYTGGDLSLREAVQIVANGGTVTFAAALSGGTITLSGSRIDLVSDVTIAGPGSGSLTIDADDRSQIFAIDESTVSISGLTLTGGKADSATAAFDRGGAIYSTRSTLTVADMVLTGNASGHSGGAIYNVNGGEFTLVRSTVTNNTSTWGGGVWADTPTVIADSTFSGNQAVNGGGLTFFGTFNTVFIVNSTVSGNTATSPGGGLSINGAATTLRNVTITGNRGRGGGIYGNDRADGKILLQNSIVAGNLSNTGTPQEFAFYSTSETLDLASSHNLIGNAASAGGLTNGENGNIVGVDVAAVLDTVLADNGGQSKTHALLPGSAALDAGSNALALDLDGTPLAFDQRGSGFDRIVGDAVDLGAFEALPTSPPVPPVLSLTLTFSPTVFMSEADGAGATTGTVTRNGDLSQALTVFLTSSDPAEATVPESVTIAAGAASATFSVDAVDDNLHDGSHTVVITASITPTPAGSLAPDLSFGTAGIATTSLSMNWQQPYAAVAIQSDGKILAAAEDAANGSWRLIRLNVDGSLDASFGSGGFVVTAFPGSAGAVPHKIVLQSDGKILVGGTSDRGPAPEVLLARYNANGTLDTSFANFSNGTPGYLNLGGTVGVISDIAVDSGGKILLAIGGRSTFMAARITEGGFLDVNGFGGGIRTYATISGSSTALTLNPDGTFFLAGGEKVARFDRFGNLVSSAVFGVNGVATVDFSLSTLVTEQVVGMAVLPDGKIVVGYDLSDSAGTRDFGAARLNADGTLDTTFSSDGRATIDFAGLDDGATSMAVQADGKILLAGYTEVSGPIEDMAIVRLGLDGTLDATFDGDGRFTQSRLPSQERFFDLVVQGQALVAVGGWVENIDVFRYTLPDVTMAPQRNLFVFDEEQLTVEISRTSFTEGEGADVATMTITRHNTDIGEALVVTPVTGIDGLVVDGFLILPETVTIAANETSVTFAIGVADDVLVNGTREFQVAATATGYWPNIIIATVADDDLGPFGAENILVSADDLHQILEYTTDGTLVRIFEVPVVESEITNLRDLAVDTDGSVHVWKETLGAEGFETELMSLDPLTGTIVTNPLLPGWSTFSNVTFGGVATLNDWVFVTDMVSGGQPTGIIRYDRITGDSVRFASTDAGGGQLEFIDLTIGLDGLLYGLDDMELVHVYDPATLAKLKTVDITQTVSPDNRAIAVNAEGDIFAAAWGDNRIRKFDGETGAVLATSGILGDLVDIDLRADGTIIASTRFGDVIVTDQSLATSISFTVAGDVSSPFVAFAATPPVVNLRPLANEGTVTPTEDAAYTGSVSGSDPESAALTFALVDGPMHGTLDFNADGSFTYTPDLNYDGDDSFSYTVSDGNSTSLPATVLISVASINDAPTFNLASYDFSLAENSSAETVAGAVTAGDVDGDSVTYSIIAGNGTGAFAIDAATGTIKVADASKLDFETTPSFSLSIRATDGTASDEATVVISLTDIAAPQVVSVEFGYGQDKWVDSSLLAGRVAPWKITSVRIAFSQDVSVDLEDLVIVGLASNYAFSNFIYDSATFTAVWTLATPIELDRLTITLDGDATAGVNTDQEYLLDGDWLDTLDVLLGDVNGDGIVNVVDRAYQRSKSRSTDIWGDINGDGIVNVIDGALVRLHARDQLPPTSLNGRSATRSLRGLGN